MRNNRGKEELKEPIMNNDTINFSNQNQREILYIQCLILSGKKDTPRNRELYLKDKIFTLLGL